MADAPVQAAPVLDYDPATRSYKSRRLIWRIVFFVICGIAGAIAGLAISPTKFRAVVYVRIPLPQSDAAGQVDLQQQAAVAAMRSPAAIAAGVSSARVNRVTFTPAQVSSKLTVRAVPQSTLVEVAGFDDAPEVAAAIVAGVAKYYVASNAFATIVGGPAIPATPQLQPLFILGGMVAGLAGAWMLLTLRWR
jgi:hypothetical protein